MNKDELYKKLMELSQGEVSNTRERIKWQRANWFWIEKSGIIALRIISILGELGITRKDLADRMNVSPQQVSKIISGNENLTLETICKVEQALGKEIIDYNAIRTATQKSSKKRKRA